MTPGKIKSLILFINITAICGTYTGYAGSIVKRDSISTGEDIENNNNSIQYHLYTPEHPEQVCFFEPIASNACAFDPNYETKILIHGFTVQLLPGNFFEQIKDTLLEYNNYNVMIVNWTQYDGEPYNAAMVNAYRVGIKVGEMINFLVSNKGVNASDVHIIGHSLGAHIAGVAGKQVSNLGRVTGLDPAGPLYSKEITFNRLTYTSAEFVDVMHTSNATTGEGEGMCEAIGSIDIFPNGGNKQPACKIGKQYRDSDGEAFTIKTPVDMSSCYHDIALPYFMFSIYKCNYLSVQCENYEKFNQGKCNSETNPTDRMGFNCVEIPGLPPESTFFLNTTAIPPYC